MSGAKRILNVHGIWFAVLLCRIDFYVKSASILYMAIVRMTADAARELEELPKIIHARVIAVIAQLERWPEVSGAKPLRGNLAGHYRKRTGDYRVQFVLKGGVVWVERIGHRDGFYED